MADCNNTNSRVIRKKLALEDVKDILDYNPETGIFLWRIRADRTPQWNGHYAGKIAGAIDNEYVRIGINRKSYYAHQIAWLWMTGNWPDHKYDIDHINLIKSDNRWSNLRISTSSQNRANTPPSIVNKSGFKGVHLDKESGKWRAAITHKNKRIALGRFHRVEDAAEAYRRAAIGLHGEFARAL